MAAVALQGCGGGGGGPSIPLPDPILEGGSGGGSPSIPLPDPILEGGSFPASYQGARPEAGGPIYHTVQRASPSGNDRAGVRIGIDDDIVDFRHPSLRSRIGFRGASFTHRRPFITDGTDTVELEDCKDTDRCRVYFVDSGGDRSRLEALARTVLQEHGFPTAPQEPGDPDDRPRYIYDTASNGFGWSVLQTGDTAPGIGLSHGTRVARVAATAAPQSILVPMANDFEHQYTITVTLPGVGTLRIGNDPFLEDFYLAYKGDTSGSVIDPVLARAIKDRHDSVDIINSSYSNSVDIVNDSQEVTAYMTNLRNLKTHLPLRWAAFTQSGRSADERTIRVWAAGNWRDDYGNGARNMDALKVYYFPELRGHTVVATALNRDETALADFANVCGNLPSDWDANQHGRHYCLTAPGYYLFPDVNGGSSYLFSGTSYAAPYVSGVLARMMAQARGQVGNTELVKRMMNTANNTRTFSDAFYYGAGVVDPTAALNAVGTLMTGVRTNRAPLQSTSLRMPAAYGDAARRVRETEVASFDQWNFPFWTPAGDLLRNGRHRMDPIPSSTAKEDADTCFMAHSYAPGASCIPWAESGPVSVLMAAEGIGAGLRLWDGIGVAGFTRNAGRLDGRASGAFSFGAGSSLAAVHFSRNDVLNLEGGWSLDGQVTLALDSPWGIGRPKGSMFQAGTALLSSWGVGLAREGRAGLTRLGVSQPTRAESGNGRLTIPVGRRLDGSHVYETRTFSLQPSRRTLTTSLVHRRPLARGEAAVSLQYTANPGHAQNPPVYGVGIAWRLSF